MSLRLRHLRAAATVLGLGALGCDAPPTAPTAVRAAPALDAAHGPGSALLANGAYHFTVPADFNGGIFGIEIGNDVSFTAQRADGGTVSGRFRYVQSAGGESFIFSGRVTCFMLYGTPVLVGYPEIPAGVANRAKWGGVIEQSNDPTVPAGAYLWFQSIDNDSGPGAGAPDLSTLSGFGDEAANEAFCASPNVPNPDFGPHPVAAGQIVVH